MNCGLLGFVLLFCSLQLMAVAMKGWYGLPQTIYGCPDNWWPSMVQLDFGADHDFRSRHRAAPDVAGPIVGGRLTLGACVPARSAMMSGNRTDGGGNWPPGRYCVYKIGSACPDGLSRSASVQISGGNVRMHRVVDPSPLLSWQQSGRQGNDNVVGIGMCCMEDGGATSSTGSSNNPGDGKGEAGGGAMDMPLDPPFMLLRAGANCQDVKGLTVRRQDLPLPTVGPVSYKVSGPLSLSMSADNNRTVMPFCFYDVEEACQASSINDTSYKCQSDNFLQNNDEITEVGPGYPARQREEPPYKQEGLKALDNDPDTCATHHTLSFPWWQMDLRQSEHVTAFSIDTTRSAQTDCLLQEATVYVSENKEDFLTDGSPVCVRNVTSTGSRHTLGCRRTLIGRYVTILQGQAVSCLSVCEFRVFVKESFCGIPLGVTDLSLTRHVQTSSKMADRRSSDVGIFSNTAWCAAPGDLQPFIQLDLRYSRMVTGVVTQGGEDPDDVVTVQTMVLMYGTRPDQLLTYEETAGVPKVFNLGDDPHKPADHTLLRPIMSRYIRLVIRSWLVRPCMRIQLVGCRDRQEPLAVSRVTDSSGTESVLLTDSLTDTCSHFNDSAGGEEKHPRLSVMLQEGGAVPLDISVISHPYDEEQQPLSICSLDNEGLRNGLFSTGNEMSCSSEDYLVVEVSTSQNVGCSPAKPSDQGCRQKMVTFRLGSTITVCEVEVYGYATVPEVSRRDLVTSLTCSSGTYIRVVDVIITSSSTETLPSGSGRILMTRRAYNFLLLLCPTDSTSCILPTTPGNGIIDAAVFGATSGAGDDQLLFVQFACIRLTSPGTVCHRTITEPGVIMTMSNYLDQYGREFSCMWSIVTTSGHHPQINIRQYQLVPSETMFYSGTFLVDPGSCRDQLWVQYVSDQPLQSTDPWMPVDGAQTFVAPGSQVNLRLVTCLRVKVTHVDAPALYVEYALSECPGCGVGMRIDDGSMTYCRAPCGNIMSLGYPGGYRPNLDLTWRITLAHRTYVGFRFTSFDIVSVDSGCKQDYVVVDDLDRTATRLINLGTYCNAKRPPEILYGDWENLQIKFISDNAVSGMGFSADYETLYYFFPDDLEWIQNDTESCPVGWDSYAASCYGFLEVPDDVTWLEADDICQSFGGNLASVKNTREMIFINFLLIQYFDGADLYIGASDRFREGRYIWLDGTPLTFTHWRKGRPDGATIEDCSGLDLDSLRFKPSWVDIPCSSREANHFVCKKDRHHTAATALDMTSVMSRHPPCGTRTMTCGDGACVLDVFRCDGQEDCADGRDESFCGPPCPTYSYDCGDGLCRPLSAVCDGRRDCPDGRDENDCVFPTCKLDQFQCASGPCIDMKWKCDLQQHCYDESDEKQCDLCSPELTFQCYDSSCLPASRHCDGTVDCPGGHKEDEGGCMSASISEARMKCKNTQTASRDQQCLFDTDRFGLLLGCRDAKHLENCADWTCPANFVKCPGSYCLAVHKVCDGKPDCPYAEDEVDCQNYTCPGMLRCRDSLNCVPRERMCDGVRQCLHGDDEVFCDAMNARCFLYGQCVCDTLVYTCVKARLKHVPFYVLKDARKLNLTANRIVLNGKQFDAFHYLIELILVDNSIEEIRCCHFDKLVNLKLLDLAYNRLTDLFADAFRGLANLERLVLTGNPIYSIEPGSFRGLVGMRKLSLQGLSVRKVKAGAFAGLDNVEELDLSMNTMNELGDDAFRGLLTLKRLNISRNVLSFYNGRDFKNLQHLEYLESDNQVFCCYVSLPVEACLPAPDAVSSCEDLLSRDVLRTFLWLLGALSLAGNIAVFGYRFSPSRRNVKQTASELLICHLAAADLLMGHLQLQTGSPSTPGESSLTVGMPYRNVKNVMFDNPDTIVYEKGHQSPSISFDILYLVAMACADAYFRGNYVENATWWKTSWGCSILGLTASVSAEMSVIIVFLITMDRLHRVKMPMSTNHLTARSASLLMGLMWTLVVFLFLVPILPNSYFQSLFYARSGVCVPIHITPDPAPGWQYSVFIFHGLNITLFTLMCVGYGSIYWTVRQMKGKKNRGLQRARKMASVVFVDFCCWVPINIMGILSLAGVEVPGAMYAWTVVFILPINSSLNPVLYTLSTIDFRKTKKEADSSEADITSRWLGRTIQVRLTTSPQESKRRLSLDQFMRTRNEEMSQARVVAKVFYRVAKLLEGLHSDRICVGELTVTNVELDLDNSLNASFLAWPDVTRIADKDAVADDMAEYGQLMTHLLRGLMMRKARAAAGPSHA